MSLSFEYPIWLRTSTLVLFFIILYKHILIPLSRSPLHLFFCLLDVFNAAVQPCRVLSRYKSFEFHSEWEGEWGWKGARGKKKKKRRAKAIRFIGSSVPLVQLVSSRRAMRATTTTRRSLIIPWRSLFFLFLLPVAASQIFRLGFGSVEKKKKEKKTITNSQGREKEREGIICCRCDSSPRFSRLRFTFDHGTSTIRE